MITRKESQLSRALTQQREDRIQTLLQKGKIKSPSDIPENAIPASLELQNQNGTWDPPLFYSDTPFVCKDCGKQEIWTATQQRWYYEIAKGPVQAKATRCRPCRTLHRAKIERHKAALKKK
jgi:Probable zinc-ribbon domain